MSIGTIRDITHIRKMERDRKNAIHRERIFKESISHYFFNPLVIAKGYIQLVIDETADDEEKKKLEAAKTAINRIESVVKNVINNGDVRE
ncbi:MAG: hypothetical protein U9O96_03715 [Candidatus Thermoplasmatota archaeon]|nr:hypothetical protein [Candidatus Thermoplasmatota archaeon]